MQDTVVLVRKRSSSTQFIQGNRTTDLSNSFGLEDIDKKPPLIRTGYLHKDTIIKYQNHSNMVDCIFANCFPNNSQEQKDFLFQKDYAKNGTLRELD